MGAGTRDMFGDVEGAHPAAPGSYGEAPRGHRLPDGTRLGPVRLQVADLERSVRYYEAVLGLREVGRSGHDVELAAHGDDRVLVELHGHPGAGAAGRHPQLGLYHFAILLPDRPSLGRFVQHLAQIGARAGAADHLVSEAFYLQDPDGLGIEVYADRPREQWRRVGRELMMATDPIDVQGLVAAAGDTQWTGMPAGTVIGHLHLHVGDLKAASDFYAEGLGFDRMVMRYPGALFLGAGGYHHHLGTNTWAGPAARPAADDDARLLQWTVELPDAEQVRAAGDSIAAAGYPVEHLGNDEVLARDPWGTALVLRTANGRAGGA